MPSSKGPNGEERGGVKIAATKAGKESFTNAPAGYYSTTGSAEEFVDALEGNGAVDLIRASKAMLPTLKALKLSSRRMYWEWLSDPAAPGYAWNGNAENANPNQNDANNANENMGVRALRNDHWMYKLLSQAPSIRPSSACARSKN